VKTPRRVFSRSPAGLFVYPASLYNDIRDRLTLPCRVLQKHKDYGQDAQAVRGVKKCSFTPTGRGPWAFSPEGEAMALPATEPRLETFADLLHQIGDVPLERIRLRPPPGTATEEDVITALDGPVKRICELVDGVLVEKPMASTESMLGGVIFRLLGTFVEEKELGVVLPGDGPVKLWLGQVRFPDVTYIPWDRFPGGKLPKQKVWEVVPELVVEVLSAGNTKQEMERKRRDYFTAGIRELWVLQPKTETAAIYTSPTKARRLGKEGSLDGGDIVPGFRLALKDLFARTKGRPSKRG
jgi:Uma2 family endonuclease